MRRLLQRSGLILAATIPGIGRAEVAERCAALSSARQYQLEILSATRVLDSCRVTAAIRPTADSEIRFELWLPDAWTGRYVQLGNGGFAGNIDQPSLEAEMRRGNAAAMTDTGHKAGQFDASWALGHPEKVVDYGYRSIRATAEAANRLITRYYTKSPRYRYYIGCSNGGRQALAAAQRYPGHWDGILAGSPAVYWMRQLAWFDAIQQRLRSEPRNRIPAEKLPAIQRAALTSCGTATTAPWLCRLRSRDLQCRAAETRECLTEAQLATLEMIQGGSFGFAATAAAAPQNWDNWILNRDAGVPGQAALATQSERYLFPSMPPAQLAATLDAADPDLRRFKARGGKLIMYLGWSDALISPAAGMGYYEGVKRRMGGRAATHSFFRLFIAPGMQHCQGGIAPNSFGQAWVAPGISRRPRHDIRSALEAWVEHGRAPNVLVAAQFAGDKLVVTQELRPFPRPAGPVTSFRRTGRRSLSANISRNHWDSKLGPVLPRCFHPRIGSKSPDIKNR